MHVFIKKNLEKINFKNIKGIEILMEAWYVFQKISYLYILLTVFTVVFLIFSFFLKKDKGRTRSSNCFLGLGGFFFSLFVLTLAAESYFYINKGSFFYNKSTFIARTEHKVTKDLDLIEVDSSNDVVDLGNFFHQEINWRSSANAKYKINQDGQNILLSSTDGKLAYLEMMLTKRLDYPGRMYQVQLSFFVKNVLDSLSYISTFEIMGGKTYQNPAFCDTSFQKCENYLLSSYFYRDIGKVLNGSPNEFKARLYTTGQEVLFLKPKFTAVRVYDPLLWMKRAETYYLPVSKFNTPDTKESLSKNLVSVEELGFSEMSGSKNKGSFYDWDPNNNKSSQKIIVAKNISLSKDNLENLKGIHFNYKNSNPNNPMQISFGVHTSGMKLHIPIRDINAGKDLRVLTELPSETLDFSSSFLQKGPLYLAKRVLGLPFDDSWRFSQSGKRTVIQRRFHKNLNDVQSINFVFNPEFDYLPNSEDLAKHPRDKFSDDEEIGFAVSCNLLLSRGRFFNNFLIAHGALPAKIFKSSGHWVFQIDLEEYLHANSTLYLEEILLFIPESISEITSGRVINSLIFGKQAKRSNSTNILKGVNIDEYTHDERIFARIEQPKDMINESGEERRRVFLDLSKLKDVIKSRSYRDFLFNKRHVIEQVSLFAVPNKPELKSSFFVSESNIAFAKPHSFKRGSYYRKLLKKSRNRFHQEVINRKKDDSTTRVLFLGGSLMAGVGTGPSTTFPLLFKGMLKSIGFSADGKEFDIVNAGQPGNAAHGYLYQYDKTDTFAGSPWDGTYFLKAATDNSRFVLKDLKADIVIMAPGYNDQVLFHGCPQCYGSQFDNKVSINQVLKPFRQNFIFQYNAIGHYIYSGIYGYLHDKARMKNLPYAEKENLRLYKNRLRLLVKKILKRSKLVFLLFPHPTKEKAPYHKYYLKDKKIFNEIAEEFNFPVYDLNENNSNKNRECHVCFGKGYWYDAIHPTGMGYNDYAVKFLNKIYSEKSPYLKILWEGH